MGMILRIASSRIVGQGDIVGRSGYFSLNLSANSVMRGRLDARRTLKSLVADLREEISNLQYRYLRGGYRKPMTVGHAEMNRFIHAVHSDDSPRYFLVEELTPAMYGRMIRIEGGPLDGYEGRLLSIRGSRVKRLIVEIPGLLVAAVEVDPEYIRLL